MTSVSVRLLFPYPWLFAVWPGAVHLHLLMLGALGERYATIATASVILAIYTMLGVAQHADNTVPFLHDPLLLLAGTCWYGGISLVAAAIFANRPASQVVSQVFVALGRYLALKASLLEPVRGRDVKALRLALAAQNGRLVGQMNRARQILLLWAQSPRPANGARPFLQWYFGAGSA